MCEISPSVFEICEIGPWVFEVFGICRKISSCGFVIYGICEIPVGLRFLGSVRFLYLRFLESIPVFEVSGICEIPVFEVFGISLSTECFLSCPQPCV